jgi:hypothetical protein
MIGHRQAHHPPTEASAHDGQIEPTVQGRDLAASGHSQPIRHPAAWWREGELNAIEGGYRQPVRHRCPDMSTPAVAAASPSLAHEPGNASSPAPLTDRAQLDVAARAAVGTPAHLINGADTLPQPSSGPGPGCARTPAPRLVARTRHTKHPPGERDRVRAAWAALNR